MVFKLIIALHTIGTNDVVTFYQFGEQLLSHGLESTYRNSIAFNHPPLTAYYLRAICKLEDAHTLEPFHIGFPFLLRLPGILSDFIVVLILLRLNLRQQLLPYWLLALFALSPVSIMVSGFHGNTDPVMVMFLVAAAYTGETGDTRGNAPRIAWFRARKHQSGDPSAQFRGTHMSPVPTSWRVIRGYIL